MINVYDRLTTDFANNGLATLTNISKAEVEESINGDYKLTIIYPLTDKKSQYLIKDNIIKVPTPYGTDLFRIFKSRRSPQDSNNVECLCRHISYDNERNFLEDVRPTNLNGYNALNWMKNNAAFPCNFNFFSDIDTLNTAYYVRKNLLDAIMSDDDNSFLKVWGGELDRRNFDFGVVKQLGTDRGFKISENKNTTDIEESVEGTEVTRVMPTGRDENDQPLLLPEKYVDSPLINNYISPSIKTIDFPNVKVSRDDAQTDYADKEAVYAELRKQVNLMYSEQHIDRPSINYTVDFADLSRTDLYKKLSILQQLYLGDICTIYSNKLKLDLKARLRSYTYDCVLKKYTKLELGDYTKSEYTVSNILNNKITTVNSTSNFIGDKIKQALGGHCIKREGEILIMDTDNIATATKVWRWNLNGFGYSKTGYNGEFGTAINMDGEINASFITTGELDANLIKTGVIISKDGTFRLDIGNGNFITYDSNGRKAIEMANQNLMFFNFNDSINDEVGRISSVYYIKDGVGDKNKTGIAITAPSGKFISISKITGTLPNGETTSENYVEFDMGALGNSYPINFGKDVYAFGDFRQKINNGYYYPVNVIQTGTVILNTHQEIRINLDNAFTGCSFKTFQLGVVQTYNSKCTGLNEFYIEDSYIDEGNNQLVLKGGVQHFSINADNSVSFMTNGTLTVKWVVFGSK